MQKLVIIALSILNWLIDTGQKKFKVKTLESHKEFVNVILFSALSDDMPLINTEKKTKRVIIKALKKIQNIIRM